MSENCVNKTSLLAGIMLSIALVSTVVCSEETSDAQRLFRAVENNEKRTVRRLVEADRRLVHARNERRETPLHRAAICGHVEVAQFLIDHGADTCSQSYDWSLPLHDAVENGSLEVVKLLLQDDNFDVNYADKEGYTPLHCVDVGTDPEEDDSDTEEVDTAQSIRIVEALIKRGADVTILGGVGKTLLHMAAGAGNFLLVRYLIEKGAPVDQKNIVGGTALHHAAGEGHLQVAEHLISNSANVNAEDHGGHTPLHIATSQGHLDVVKLLIEAGADVESITRKDNQTPLSLALTGSPHVAEYLIERYAAVNKLQAGISPSLQDLLSKRRAHLVESIDDSPFCLPEVLRNEIIEFVTEI